MVEQKEQAAPQLNLFAPENIQNPYPLYHALRAQGPVYWLSFPGLWVVTGYAEVMAALRDPRFLANRASISIARLKAVGREDLIPFYQTLQKSILVSDPPDHTRLRGLVSKAFTPKVVAGMRDHIQEIVDDLLDQAQPAGRMDLMPAFAYPLPVIVIAELLGVPLADREKLKRWSDDLAAFVGNPLNPIERIEQAQQTLHEFEDYFRDLIPRLRQQGRQNLLSALATVEEQGDRLTEEEMLVNCMLLLVAGHETTTNLIGNGLLALFRHPDQLRRLRERPELIENAVEELLRYDGPAQFTGRLAREDVDLGGQTIRQGQLALFVLGAANHDPAQFPDPDRVDLDRRELRHAAFGQGPHFCLGAPLARLESQIAFKTLLRRLPNLRLAAEPPFRFNFALRGLTSLEVAWDPS